MYVRKKLHGLMAAVLALMMCVAMLPTAAFAAETDTTDSSKTLTVGSGQTYTTIQAAINYINEQDDKTEWTITVESGTYKRFTVLSGLDGLTIQAADNASVTISTWDGTESEEGSVPKKQESYYLYNGIYIMSQNVTLKGMTINVGWDVDVSYATTLRTGLSDFDLPNSSCWYVAGIRTTKADSADGLVIDTCNFTSSIQGDDSNTNYGILTACYSFTVKNSTFNGFWQGISVMGDYYAVDNVSITKNTFTDCNRAISIYYKVAPEDTSNMGDLSITDNVITGSSNVRSKIILHDVSSNGSMGNVTLSGNEFSYGFVLIVNFAESPDTINGKTVASGEAKSAVFADNTWKNGSFYVESSEYYNSSTGYTGTISVDYPELAYYEAPESDTGYWVLNTDLDSSPYTGTYANPEGTTEYVQSVIAAANEAGSHTLSFTFDDEEELIWTLTAFKDAIYWVSGTMPTAKEDLPGLDKTIVLDDGSEVEQDDVAAGDTVDYKLTSNVPSNLDEYIDYTGVGDNTNVVPLGTVKTYVVTDENGDPTYDEDGNEITATYTYTLTFHDEMDSALSYNSDAKVTLVTYELDDDGNVTSTVKKTVDVTTDYATITTSGLQDDCDFEVSIDLLALYAKGIITESDFGSAEIIVTFSATLSKDATAGSYKNTAWVVYPNGNSEKDTVEVDTYKLSVFKYDQADNTVGLPGATFTVTYPDGSTKDVTSDADGYVTLDGLDAGTYTVQETKAPDGYVKADTVLTVTIPTDATDYVASVSFANAAIPSTGGAGTTMYTVAGICIILIAGAALVVTRKTRREE